MYATSWTLQNVINSVSETNNLENIQIFSKYIRSLKKLKSGKFELQETPEVNFILQWYEIWTLSDKRLGEFKGKLAS